MKLNGKVAIITGAGSGMGAEEAKLFAAEGAKVVITDILDAEGRAAAEAIGQGTLYLHHDVAQEADWEAAIARTLAAHGRLDVLVNNAGVALSASVEACTLEQWRWLMSINLDGVFLGTKHAVLAMKGHGGSIINLSSIEGIIGDPNLAAYNASKGGVRIFTKSAALHCARSGYNIRVNSIHPGYISTPMVEGYVAEQDDPAAARTAIAALHPLGHIGEPADIAHAVVYLASEESKFMTGAELVVDGGYTAQ